jgi:predicted O-methyltransferase YrrM
MTPERWSYTNMYAQSVFGEEDDLLRRLVREAAAEEIPNLAVSADIGRLLGILVALTPGRLALEIGTLAGYSAIWITRGLAPGGKLITVEHDDRHADFAARQFDHAGLTGSIELIRGAALDVLPAIAAAVGEQSVDFVFVDADKREYPDYFVAVRPLVAVGGLFVADNVFGTGDSWIDDLSHPGSAATDRMNRIVAADADFEATALAVRSGVLIARRVAA